MVIKRETLTVSHILSGEELLNYGMLLAAERPKEEQLDNELKEFSDQVKANKAKIKTRIADLSNRINSKREYRQVECSIQYLYEAGERVWVREDTGEIAKREQITDEERQVEMDIQTPDERE